MVGRLGASIAVVVVVLAGFGHLCWGKQYGITGFSGLQGETCGDSCHGDEPAPLLEVDGPRLAMPGAVVSWRVALRPRGSRALGGGVNVAVSAGALVPETGLYLELGELTHMAPARSADGNGDGAVTAADVIQNLRLRMIGLGAGACLPGDVSGDAVTDEVDTFVLARRLFRGGAPLVWEFRWIAPATPQEVQFFAAAVAANCNGTRGGDGTSAIRWAVSVTPKAGGSSVNGSGTVLGNEKKRL